MHTNELPGRTVKAGEKELLYFSGTSYLGMGKNTAFREQLQESLAQYGTNYSSSRTSNLQLGIYEETEDFLAHFTGADAALTLSSGYLACQAVVQNLAQTHRFIYAPNAHPALCRSSEDFYTGNYAEWSTSVSHQLEKKPASKWVIVSNSLDALLARQYDFEWVKQLPADQDITLLIDDSHGFGIIGENGAGIYASLKPLCKNLRLIVVSSFGKAFGIPGGLVLGDKPFIQNLKKSPYFSGSSPIIPAYLDTFLRAQELFQKARKNLFENIAHFSRAIAHTNLFQYFENYPVFYTPENHLYTALKNRCVLSSFSYPTPDSRPITRVVLSSLHFSEDINQLVRWIHEYQQGIYETK